MRQIVVGVSKGKTELILDWKLVKILNHVLKNKRMDENQTIDYDKEELSDFINIAEKFVNSKTAELNTPFEMPDVKLLSLLIPSKEL
jgi:hypothetical protein